MPVLAGAAGCVRREDEAADPLLDAFTSARADAALATALAALGDERSAAYAVIAAQRNRHADVLADEIERLHPGSDATSSAEIAADPAPSLDGLRAALAASSQSAQALAAAADGYRAGLLGSIAAGVFALVQVQLA